MVSLLAVFAALTAVYVAVLLWFARNESERFQVMGPLLMLRTQAGKRLIDKLARRKWWGRVADVFIVLTVLAAVVMVVLVVWQNTLLFTHTEAVRERPPQVQEALAIPGVNPVIPIWYGLVALLVALVIHEGGHGVLCRYAHLRVKSLGLLFLVIPVGAFVEPDEEALQGTSLRNKLRMFAAGPGPNMVLAGACVLLFAQVLVPAMMPSHQGVAIMGVSEDLPAGEAGIEAGMFVTAVDGQPVNSNEGFSAALNVSHSNASWSWSQQRGDANGTASDGAGNGTAEGNQTGDGAEAASSNETVTFTVWRDGETREIVVTPVDRYLYFEENAPSANQEWYKDKPFIGVNPSGQDGLASLKDRFQHPFETMGVTQGSLFYLAMPFINLQPFPGFFHDIFEPTGLFAGWGAAFWITANTLYWLFWINMVLGTFNALPMGPLDGGHMFRHSLHWWFRRREGIHDRDLDVVSHEGGSPTYMARRPEIQDRLEVVDDRVSLVNRALGFSLLALVVAPLIVPQFL